VKLKCRAVASNAFNELSGGSRLIFRFYIPVNALVFLKHSLELIVCEALHFGRLFTRD
jgi:hypothetical protein